MARSPLYVRALYDQAKALTERRDGRNRDAHKGIHIRVMTGLQKERASYTFSSFIH